MFVLRVVAILVAIAIGASLGAYVVTRNPQYLGFAWRLFRYSILLALGVFALMILERVLAVV